MRYPNNEAEDRAIAQALDADTNIDEADMDVAAIDEYRKVLAHLPFEEIAPPTELEDRVLEAALARRPAAVRSIARPARRRAAVRWAALGGAVAAAAGVIAFMITTTDSGGGIDGGRIVLAGDARSVVLAEPGVRTAPLTNGQNRRLPQQVGNAALAPNGEGVLYDLELPAPTGQQTLQVWLVTDDNLVPIGTIPTTAEEVGFSVDGDVDAVKGIALSVEPTGTPDTTSPRIATATF